MGMAPPGQQIGQPAGQPTIVLGRPGQPGSSVVNNPGLVRQQFLPPGGGIRVQGKILLDPSNRNSIKSSKILLQSEPSVQNDAIFDNSQDLV